MKRSGLKRKTGLKSDPEKTRAFIERGRVAAATSSRQKQKAAAKDDPLREPFRARRPARTQQCAGPGCRRRAVSWHHWLPQEAIRMYVRSLRLRDDDAIRKLLRRLLKDERNLSPFCEDCHGSHGTTAHEFPAEQVPPDAFAFARELGAEWIERLRRAYR